MELYLATQNQHKREEFERLLPGVTVHLPKDIGLDFDPEETGKNFHENALIKAEALYRMVKKPVLADDSGLCVEALDGQPGIHSARFGSQSAGRNLSAAEKNTLLLSLLKGTKKRGAHFVCCLVFMYGDDQFISVQETVNGTIALKPSGTTGFGYDPIFLLPEYGISMAEAGPDLKDEVSHRGRAARKLLTIIKQIVF